MNNTKLRCALIFLASLLGCASLPSKGPTLQEKELYIKKHVTNGMNIDDAKRIMLSCGFECKIHKNSDFITHEDADDRANSKVKLENVNYLSCHYRDTRNFGYSTYITSYALLFKEDKIYKIYSYWTYVGF